MTMADPSARLRRRFIWLLIGAAVPLLTVMVILGLREMDNARADILRELADAGRIRRAGLEQLAAEVDTHIAVMRAFAEQRLAQEADQPAYDGAMDWPPYLANPGPDHGMLLGNPDRLTPEARREISALASMFALARATQASRPWMRWSYFFSETRRYVAIYPWAPPQEMLAPGDPDAALADYFTYDLYTLAEPAANPDHKAYWSPVYLDAGGTGLMVTRGAPVWVKGQFRGIVGADVLLSYLSKMLGGFPVVSARVAVVDQADNLVATPDGFDPSAKGPVAAQSLMQTADLSDTGGKFLPRGPLYVASVLIEGTPWRLVMTLPRAEVQARARDRMAPMGLLVAGVLVVLATVAAILDRQFVIPAVALADYGTKPSAEIVRLGPPEDLPAPFRPLIDRITEAARLRFAQTVQLRAMVDGVPLRVVYLDAELIYRDANREFLSFMGKTAAEVIGHPVAEILGPEVEAQYRAITPLIRRGEIGRFEGWITYQGTGRRYLQVSILPFIAPGESLPGYLTFTRDLTELKAAEQEAEAHVTALAEREALYRSVVISALDGIVVMDDQGIAHEFNPAAEAIFGYTAAEAIGRRVGDLIVPPEARATHEAGMARYLASGEARVIGRRIEVEAMRKDGSRLPVELAITRVSEGGRQLFVSHLRDLTEAKRLAREMQEGRDRLHQVEKLSAMGSLLAGVAHELNNPLAIAVAQATLLVERAKDPDIRTRAERIRAAANRCGRIVKSFLAMARQKPPQRERLDVAEVIRGALELVGYGLRSAGVEVVLDLADDLPQIDADRDLMGQVFSNLFINAQQVLTTIPLPRLVRVEARVEPQEEGDVLLLRFQDNGTGVPEALRARIFDAYFTTKAVDVGTGIGLSISRNVVEAHGGSIRLAAKGEGDLPGACFEIRLPIATAAEAAPAGRADAAGSVGRDVLIVDDEPDVALSLSEILQLAGHRATVCASSAAALQALRAGAFDLVFTDLRMPGMDGAELALQAAELRPDLAGRIVLMTGDTVSGPARAAQVGLETPLMLEKPFTPAEVATLLARIV